MHKIYINNGKFDILYQISQILYSSIIPSVINGILKYLSLSEKSILILKKAKKAIDCFQQSQNVERCLKLKCIIFFIFSFLIMLFFWYFITCFCAVYTNTQIILIKNTLFSYGLSMIYTFGIYLLPGIFRIPALKALKIDKNTLYKISIILSLI